MFKHGKAACYWYLTPASTLHLTVTLPSGKSSGETMLGVVFSADALSDAAWEIAEAALALPRSGIPQALRDFLGSAG